MRFGSVCSGIEAATVAFQSLNWTPVFYSEVEPFSSAVLMQRLNATKPMRPLAPNDANNEKEKKQRKNWSKQIDLMANTGEVPNLGDFTKIKESDYDGDIDLLIGGTPCQSFSLAGLRAGLKGESGLALDFVRLCYDLKPKWIIWENVQGVLSSNKGRDFSTLLSMLTGLQIDVPAKGWKSAGVIPNIRDDRFGVAWRVLDGQYTRVDEFPFAIPQRRRRLFLVGYFGDWQRAAKVLLESQSCLGSTPPKHQQAECYTLRFGEHPKRDLSVANDFSNVSTMLLGNKRATRADSRLYSFTDEYYEETSIAGAKIKTYAGCGFGKRVASHVASTITGDHDDRITGNNSALIVFHGSQDVIFNHSVANCVGTNQGLENCFCIVENIINRQDHNGGNGKGFKADVSYTLNCTGVHGVVYSSTARRIMPIECERLMGFPDDWTKIIWNNKGIESCPDSYRYKACGNSIMVNQLIWIARRIEDVEALKKKEEV